MIRHPKPHPTVFRNVLWCCCLLACAASTSFAQSAQPYVEGEVIVGFASDAKATATDALRKELGATVHYRFALVRAEVWRITTMTTAEAVRRYAGDVRVRYVEPNYVAEPEPESKGVPVTPDPPSRYDAYVKEMGEPTTAADRARAAESMTSSACGSAGPISNDPLSDKQWSLHNVGAAGAIGGDSGYTVHCDADVDGPEALTVFTGTTKSVVAIVDGGGWNHVDYAANLWANPEEDFNGNGMGAVLNGNGRWRLDSTDFNGLDDDGNGLVDDLIGWDFVQSDKDPQAPVDPWFNDGRLVDHGVRVSGITGAVSNNGVGITSLSPLTRLMILRGSGHAAAVDYGIREGARVVNASWENGSADVRQIIQNAAVSNVLVVAAAGNGNAPTNTCSNNNDNTNDLCRTPLYPASWPEANIISVAGLGPADESVVVYQGTTYLRSSYGRKTVDLGAPAAAFRTSDPNYNPPYSSVGGGATSFAAPHVSAAAGMLWSQDPALPYWKVKNLLLASVDPVPSLWNRTVSGGRLNAYNALRLQRGLLPQTLALNQPIVDPGSHLALGTISASAAVTAPPVGVKLVAGQGITFGPGFSVQLGTLFVAEVRGSLNTWSMPPAPGFGAAPPEAPSAGGLAASEGRAGASALPADVPTEYALHASWPNPARGRASIRFDLPEAAGVVLSVFDVRGRQVARLVDGPMGAGEHTATFDGAALPSGVYLYRLQAGPFVRTGRLVLMN